MTRLFCDNAGGKIENMQASKLQFQYNDFVKK